MNEQYVCGCGAVLDVIELKTVGDIYPRVSVCQECGRIALQTMEHGAWRLADAGDLTRLSILNNEMYRQIVLMSDGVRRATQ